MQLPDNNGLVHLSSPHTAAHTLERLQTILLSKNMQIFATIDHSAAASSVGLSMPFATVLIFGSPRGGTPLMLAAPTLAIDLPLKALVWQDQAGAVWLSYNTPEYLAHRHAVPGDLIQAIAGIRTLCETAVQPA